MTSTQDLMNTETRLRPFARSVFVLLRHWRFLVVITLVAAVSSVIYALTLPDWYKATSTFLPPKDQTGTLERLGAGLSTTLRSIGLGTGTGDQVYSYISILESRRISENVIGEFDLFRVYDITDGSMEKALRALNNNTDFTFEEDGLVAISVWDQDAKRAAEMANFYLSQLRSISTALNVSEARAKREFMELQYMSVLDSLRDLENRFVAFQKRTKIYALPEQTEASLRAAGSSYAELSMLNVYLKLLEQRLGPDDAEVQNLRIMTKELERQIPGYGKTGILGVPGTSMDNLPDEALQYMRMYRDIETLSKLSALLLPMYQQSVLDEQKQMHVLVPLDLAVPAERKDRPKRSIIIVVLTMSVLTLGGVFLLLRDRMHYYRLSHPGEWEDLRRAFRFGKTRAS